MALRVAYKDYENDFGFPLRNFTLIGSLYLIYKKHIRPRIENVVSSMRGTTVFVKKFEGSTRKQGSVLCAPFKIFYFTSNMD